MSELVWTELDQRLKAVEHLLWSPNEKGVNPWSYEDIREILERTDLSPDMRPQELRSLDERVKLVEGCIEILHASHLNHTNSSDIEFNEMHGFMPLKTDLGERIEGIQAKLDRVLKVLEKFTVTMPASEVVKI